MTKRQSWSIPWSSKLYADCLSIKIRYQSKLLNGGFSGWRGTRRYATNVWRHRCEVFSNTIFGASSAKDIIHIKHTITAVASFASHSFGWWNVHFRTYESHAIEKCRLFIISMSTIDIGPCHFAVCTANPSPICYHHLIWLHNHPHHRKSNGAYNDK